MAGPSEDSGESLPLPRGLERGRSRRPSSRERLGGEEDDESSGPHTRSKSCKLGLGVGLLGTQMCRGSAILSRSRPNGISGIIPAVRRPWTMSRSDGAPSCGVVRVCRLGVSRFTDVGGDWVRGASKDLGSGAPINGVGTLAEGNRSGTTHGG
jgi:hypothetical protein